MSLYMNALNIEDLVSTGLLESPVDMAEEWLYMEIYNEFFHGKMISEYQITSPDIMWHTDVLETSHKTSSI